MPDSHQPIGIFDSGLGGLTVFREVSSQLPREHLIYLGDTARVPYGTKSAKTVCGYARQNVDFLLRQKVKAVVVACNTASAFALESLQKEFSIPVLGVIEPGAAGALKATKTGRIGVIGTEGTIASRAYEKILKDRSATSHVAQAACPLFVPLVEEGWWNHEVTETVARSYLEPLLSERIDALILGCTHYPLLKKVLANITGSAVTLIDSAAEAAKALAEILRERRLDAKETNNSQKEFFVTDAPDRFRRLGELFLGQKIETVQHVDL